jgi:hypothetical protein
MGIKSSFLFNITSRSAEPWASLRIFSAFPSLSMVNKPPFNGASANYLPKKKQLKQLDLPVELDDFPFHLAWHRRYQKDPAHQWLRNHIMACGDAI